VNEAAARATASGGGIPPMSDADFRRLGERIHATLGIRMPLEKKTMIQSRLLRRLHARGLRDFRAYCDLLLDGAGPDAEAERALFFDLVTTNKTSFFREPEHFRYLIDVALPELTTRARGRPLRAWSVPCSTGEEPYSLAMVLAEHLAAARDGAQGFEVLATDVSTRVLTRAAKGIFAEPQIEPVPHELRKRYLLRGRNDSAGLVRVAPELRARVRFGRLNLMDARYPVERAMDVIFCRNVLIYFDRPTQEAVIEKLCAHLAPGGVLCVGMAETLHGMLVPVKLVGKSVYRNL
jgi:chemotaxis protein methyltransferase CheR